MSADLVDDLHAAEDRIGLLELTLENFVNAYVRAAHVGHLQVPGLFDAAKTAQDVLRDRYQRPSCDEDCDDEFCGSPRHHDQTFNDTTGEWEDE